jgi:hypothetical protein
MCKNLRPRDTTYDITEKSPLFKVDSLISSRYYSSIYWKSRLILEPDNEEILYRYYSRLAELEELRELRCLVKKRQETLIVEPPPRSPSPPRQPQQPQQPQQPRSSKPAPWVPPPLTWD